MSQPRVVRLARRSSAGSSRVTKTAGCPRRTPSARNWPAKTVLALPACPATTVARRRGSPPMVTWSKPGMPVSSLRTPLAPPGRSRPTAVGVRLAGAADRLRRAAGRSRRLPRDGAARARAGTRRSCRPRRARSGRTPRTGRGPGRDPARRRARACAARARPRSRSCTVTRTSCSVTVTPSSISVRACTTALVTSSLVSRRRVCWASGPQLRGLLGHPAPGRARRCAARAPAAGGPSARRPHRAAGPDRGPARRSPPGRPPRTSPGTGRRQPHAGATGSVTGPLCVMSSQTRARPLGRRDRARRSGRWAQAASVG